MSGAHFIDFVTLLHFFLLFTMRKSSKYYKGNKTKQKNVTSVTRKNYKVCYRREERLFLLYLVGVTTLLCFALFGEK